MGLLQNLRFQTNSKLNETKKCVSIFFIGCLGYRLFLPATLRAAHICRYLVYSEADFEVFRPAGATRCTDGGEI